MELYSSKFHGRDVPPVSVPQRMKLCSSGSSVGGYGINFRLGCASSTSSLMEPDIGNTDLGSDFLDRKNEEALMCRLDEPENKYKKQKSNKKVKASNIYGYGIWTDFLFLFWTARVARGCKVARQRS